MDELKTEKTAVRADCPHGKNVNSLQSCLKMF